MNYTNEDLHEAKVKYLTASNAHQGYHWMQQFKTIYREVHGEVVMSCNFCNKLKEVS